MCQVVEMLQSCESNHKSHACIYKIIKPKSLIELVMNQLCSCACVCIYETLLWILTSQLGRYPNNTWKYY